MLDKEYDKNLIVNRNYISTLPDLQNGSKFN